MILKVDPDVLSLNEKYLNNQKKTVIFLIPSITNKITPKKFQLLELETDRQPVPNGHTSDSNLPISVLMDQIKQTKPKPNLPSR